VLLIASRHSLTLHSDERWTGGVGPAASLAVDLAAEWTPAFRGTDSPGASPLALVLGLDGSETRALELAYMSGPSSLGRRLPGEKATGKRVARHVLRAQEKRAADFAAVKDGVDVLAGYAPDAAVRVQPVLDRLARSVRLTVPDWTDAAHFMLLAYESEDLLALAAAELFLMAAARANVNVCRHCQCHFVSAERTDEVYCRRAAPGEPVGGRTCRQVGPQRHYAEHLNGPRAIYRREYRRLQKRAARGTYSRDALTAWRAAARPIVERAEREGWADSRIELVLAEISEWSK